MKVVIVSTFYPLRGGIAHFNSLLFKTLTRRGHTVKAITFSRQYPKIFFPGKTQDEQGTESEAYKTNARVMTDSINPFSWIRTGFAVASEKPDVVIFKYWMPFFAPCYFVISLIAKWFSKAKVVYILDNFIPHEKRIGDGVLLWLATRLADGYVAMSNTVEQDLLAYFPSGVRYEKAAHPVYNIFGEALPRSEAREKLGLTNDEKVVLFFGYIRKYKGLDTLFEALATLNGIKLLVVGEFYGDEAFYRNKISELGIADKLILRDGYLPNDEVAKYFSACDLVVLPYRSATQSGIVQIAYNFDRPCLVTDVGGLAEVVHDGETGFIVPPENPAALAAAITRFYDENRAASFEAAVKVEKLKYSWDIFAEAIERLSSKINR
jgi:glycosyltransferase involved in cell wall biosynthesis